ncbi:MAG TPA: hypothetical protein V6D02_06485 [Candidatus Obscuribacterales bacterium]
MNSAADDVRKEALLALTAEFMTQGHPPEYAKYMAMAAIFQADLDLRNAQLSGLLQWLQTHHATVYGEALTVVETIRQEFETRVQEQS